MCGRSLQSGTVSIVRTDSKLEVDTGLQMDTSLIKPDNDGIAFVLIINTRGYTLKLDTDTELGHVSEAQTHDLECKPTEPDKWNPVAVQVIATDNTNAQKHGMKLMEMLCKENMSKSCTKDQQKLYNLLQEKHEAFALSETEQGRTDLIQFKIDTGDASSKRQSFRIEYHLQYDRKCSTRSRRWKVWVLCSHLTVHGQAQLYL